ncbi:MAG: class I SAM-dependent methyltransferase [Gemmatimonadota bacterium]
MDTKRHWDEIYGTNAASDVSWFQPEARLSLEVIQEAVPARGSAILDVGGGASTLVDGLLGAGYTALTVLDLSSAALAQARERVRVLGERVTWLEADILSARLPAAEVDLWHDRAVFHFLTTQGERHRYIEQVRRAVRPGGHLLIATFAEDGPTRCSGLEVARYSPQALHAEFGAGFRLVRGYREDHLTPRGAHQAFTYCLCRWEPHAAVPPAT